MHNDIKITDVAKLAGVSASTVSRVLANNSYVAQVTREKVLEVIQNLDYKPNRLASNFRKKSSNMIMAIIPEISNPFFNEIIRGFQDCSSKMGYHMFLADTRNDVNLEREYMELFDEKFVDGVILASSRISLDEIQSSYKNVPLVMACQYLEGGDIPTLFIDNIVASREATEYLIGLGHRRIGFISGSLQVALNRDRLKGYRQAFDIHGIPLNQSYIQEGDFSVESGYNNMKKFLAMDKRPTAIFAASDSMAVGAMQCIKQHGLRTPNDISVMGFDDIPLCTLVEPKLTTISQPKYEMGTQAMTMLFQILAKQPLARRQIVMQHVLVERESCSAPPLNF